MWRDNSYPGAAHCECSVSPCMYSFSFANDHPLVRAFSASSWAPFRLISKLVATGLACAFALISDPIPKSTGPNSTPRMTNGIFSIRDGGIETAVDMLVSAAGLFNQPLVPDLPGRETFNGSAVSLFPVGLARLFAGWQNSLPLSASSARVPSRSFTAIAPGGGQLLVCQRSPQHGIILGTNDR